MGGWAAPGIEHLARFRLTSLRDLSDIKALEEAGWLDPEAAADVPSDSFNAMLRLSDEEE